MQGPRRQVSLLAQAVGLSNGGFEMAAPSISVSVSFFSASEMLVSAGGDE